MSAYSTMHYIRHVFSILQQAIIIICTIQQYYLHLSHCKCHYFIHGYVVYHHLPGGMSTSLPTVVGIKLNTATLLEHLP